MLIHGPRYFHVLKRALAEADRASLAIAFWGAGAERLFAGWQGRTLRIICNLSLGGTNPAAITLLRQLPGAEVRQLSDLHAKLVLTDHQLVVGSANASTNGLGLEQDEVAGWREIGMLSDDPGDLRSAAAWFRSQWQAALPITQADLDAAAVAWRRRRGRRPQVGHANSFMAMSADALRDRPVYFAVFRSFSSQRAKQELENVRATIANEQEHQDLASGLEVFEGWTAGELPTDPDAAVIQVYWGPRGALAIYSVLRPVPELARTYIDDDEDEPVRLDFLVKREKAGLWSLSKTDRDRLKGEIRAWVDQLDLQDGHGRCIPAFEWRQWQAEQAAHQPER